MGYVTEEELHWVILAGHAQSTVQGLFVGSLFMLVGGGVQLALGSPLTSLRWIAGILFLAGLLGCIYFGRRVWLGRRAMRQRIAEIYSDEKQRARERFVRSLQP